MTYLDMLHSLSESRNKLGFRKIQMCANQALSDGFVLCWIDTCCIDKSSSSELSEAINSMFRWYKNATVCYAYLSDIPRFPKDYRDQSGHWSRVVSKSRWFTRGWTLQELIAPQQMNFYNKEWELLGTKKALVKELKAITNISTVVLLSADVFDANVCEIMNWAADRSTTRIEDMAYCLLGLFNINMPLLYGEGERAFVRLQEEIIKSTGDLSVFCWRDPSTSFYSGCGPFARSPQYFRGLSVIPAVDDALTSHHMTNKGLKIKLSLIPRDSSSNEYIAILRGLRTWVDDEMENVNQTDIGFYLAEVAPSLFIRVDPQKLVTQQLAQQQEDTTPKTITIMQNPGQISGLDPRRISGVVFQLLTDDTQFLDESDLGNDYMKIVYFRKQSIDSPPPPYLIVRMWNKRNFQRTRWKLKVDELLQRVHQEGRCKMGLEKIGIVKYEEIPVNGFTDYVIDADARIFNSRAMVFARMSVQRSLRG